MASPEPFGSYALVRRLAVGGMAEVFLARRSGQAGFSKACVVKRILPHLAEDADFVTMFLDEARLAARLNHPQLVQVFDFGQAGDSYFLVMEYLAGEDLAAVLRRSREQGRPVPVEVAMYLVARAADALHYAHELRGETGTPLHIVHRDISPSNLLATYQGAVKVLDFGIARAESRLQHTEAGQVKGKRAYMSPEQARGLAVDRRADVWSLGVCLYELLTGVRPFQTEASSVHAPLPPPRSLRPELPEALDAIVAAALHRELERRLPTAEALRQRLEDVLARGAWHAPETRLREYLLALFGEERARSRMDLTVLPPSPDDGPGTLDLRGGEGAKSPAGQDAVATEDLRAGVRAAPPAGRDEADTEDLRAGVRAASPAGRDEAATEDLRASAEIPASSVSAVTVDLRAGRKARPAPPEAQARSRGQRARWPWVFGTALAGVLAAGGVWRTVVPPSSAPLTAPVSSPPAAITAAPAERSSTGSSGNTTVTTARSPEAADAAPAGSPSKAPSGSAPDATARPPEASETAPASTELAVASARAEARPDAPEVGAPASETPPAADATRATAPAPTPSTVIPASARAPSAPASRTSSASRSARLSVESNLVGARAWVDGKPVGPLPLRELGLKAGAHRLRVQDPTTGASREARLMLKAGQHHIERVTLGQGTLNVLVEPWADVWLGERHLGQTPLAGVTLWEGQHRVRLVHPSGSRVVSVSVRPGQTAVVRERLP